MKLSRNKIEKLLNGKKQSRKNFKAKAKAKTNTMANTNSYHHVMSDDDMVFMSGKHRRKAHSERVGKRPVNLRVKSLKRHRGKRRGKKEGRTPAKMHLKKNWRQEIANIKYRHKSLKKIYTVYFIKYFMAIYFIW